jgi:hypothetical protein
LFGKVLHRFVSDYFAQSGVVAGADDRNGLGIFYKVAIAFTEQ